MTGLEWLGVSLDFADDYEDFGDSNANLPIFPTTVSAMAAAAISRMRIPRAISESSGCRKMLAKSEVAWNNMAMNKLPRVARYSNVNSTLQQTQKARNRKPPAADSI